MSFVSVPKRLTLPDEAFYPIERLFLFDRHNRLTWEQEYGEQAPPWDKERRIKRWADTSVLDGVDDPDNHLVVYDHFDMAARAFKKFTMTAREASLPNLPGKYVYPTYVIEATPAVITDAMNNYPQPLNPSIICHKAEAEAIAKELGADEVVQAQSFMAGPFVILWNGESRRRWLIRIGSEYHSAAALIRAKNGQGVGAPGEWVISPSGPRWVSHAQDTGDQDPRPEIPIPCRLLYEGEALYLGHPMKVVVYRKDMESDYNPKSIEGVSGLTPDEAEALRRIDANVQQLLAFEICSPE